MRYGKIDKSLSVKVDIAKNIVGMLENTSSEETLSILKIVEFALDIDKIKAELKEAEEREQNFKVV